MRIYEEYESPQEKRRAQREAKRGVATGKARGYLLVYYEDGGEWHGDNYCFNAIGELYAGAEPGEMPRCITHVTPSVDFLQGNCRFVGFDTIPDEWKRAFARKLDDCLCNDDCPGMRSRYRRVLKYTRM